MGKNFYISDWHYDHRNILAYDNRPFTELESMNKALVSLWNEAVTEDDTVYVLGDMFWCKEYLALPILDELKGTKVLVKGNHDQCRNTDFVKRFAEIDEYIEITDNGNKIVLCHYPIPCFKNHTHGWYHFYGHVHNSFEAQMMEHDKVLMEELFQRPHNMFNVGAMMPYINYTPRTFDEIVGYEGGR